MYSPLTKQLIDALRRLPGIGPKSAQRMAFQLLNAQHRDTGLQLAEKLNQALTHIKHCDHCRIYTEELICGICSSPKRDQTRLCVVESPADVVALEQTNIFNGVYFVLHGALSPLDGIGPEQIGIARFEQRIATIQPSEIILATNPTVEGEATAHYLASVAAKHQLTCSRLAHGIPLGGELEYLDGITLSHALNARTTVVIDE